MMAASVAPCPHSRQTVSPTSATTAQTFEGQIPDSLLGHHVSTASASVGLGQDVPHLQSDFNGLEEQMQSMPDKEERRLRRRITNRESAMRMRKKRADDNQAAMDRLRMVQGENLRLKQLQVGWLELLHKLRREAEQWQVRAQNAQRQNASLMAQILQGQVPRRPGVHAPVPPIRTTLPQPRLLSRYASAPLPAHNLHLPMDPRQLPEHAQQLARYPASLCQPPSKPEILPHAPDACLPQLDPALQALVDNIINNKGDELPPVPGMPNGAKAGEGLTHQELQAALGDDDADFMSMMQLLAGAEAPAGASS